MEIRPKHRVSTKLALYSHDLKSILVMRYPVRKRNGLPGGHVERNEHPDDTMNRELMEELNLKIDTMKRADFFLDRRIILAYTAVAPADIVIKPSHSRYENAEWVTKDELKNVDMSPEYIRFALENWPN